MMGQAELGSQSRAAARLALEELGRAAGGIGAVHHAVASRVFRAVGPHARPVQLAHDGIARAVYASIGVSFRASGRIAERTLPDRPVPPLLLGITNGLIGDVLEREGSPLAQPMLLRVDGPLDRRVVVFMHGLMETEASWGSPSYGERLAEELGVTPVFVRYNSGRRISTNGRELAERLEALGAQGEIALVGHSMGCLIARSACHQAKASGMEWVERVRHVVSLGTPHLGAPLEQGVHYFSHALSLLPETAPVARFLRRRSGGIRDLRHGSLVDEDWLERDPDALRAAACREVPLLDGVTHCFVSATITVDPRHPLGRMLGDWLVLHGSATGRGRFEFSEEHGHHVGGASHFALLNHPAVYDRLRQWLTATPTSASSSACAAPA